MIQAVLPRGIKIKDMPFQIIDGDRSSNYPKGYELLDSGYCLFLSAKNVTKDGFDFNQKQFITADKDKSLRKGKLERGDVILTTRGTVGNVALYDDSVSYEHIRINSGMVIIRCNKETLLPRYLYFVLKSRLFQNQVENFRSGSAQPQLPIRDMKNMRLPLPSIEEQEGVINQIGTIDEKIELNRKMNETLEQMGQALFRHYFIDNPEVEKWRDGVISDLVNIYSGYAFKRADFDAEGGYGLVTIKNVQDGNFFAECSDHLADIPEKVPDYVRLRSGDVLLSLTGNVGRVCIAYGDNLLLNQRVSKLVGVDSRYSFAYFMFRQNEFKDKLISMSRGTAQLNLSPVETKKIKIKLPPKDVLERFYGEAELLFEAITENYQQTQTLITLRDTLLPRLINGKVKI